MNRENSTENYLYNTQSNIDDDIDKSFIFSIRDYKQFINYISSSIFLMLVILYILSTTTPEQRSISFRSHKLLSVCYSGLVFSILNILFMKKEMIYFYKDKIIYRQGKRYKEIILDNNVSSYMGHIYACWVPTEIKRIRMYKLKNNFIHFIVIIISLIILYPPISYILRLISYKEMSLNLKSLIIADNNLNVISIPYYKRDKEKLVKYFKDTLNIDISKLHTIYSLPNLIKEIKGKCNEKSSIKSTL